MNELSPCIIGVAQKTYRPKDGDAPEPLLQWEEVSRAAAADCGNSDILNCIDETDVIFALSWKYYEPVKQLAKKLNLPEGHTELSGLSGTSAQKFINDAAEKILAGEREAVLVVGGEANATKKRAKKENRKLDWPMPEVKQGMPPFEDPFIPTELAHNVFSAYTTFALLDSARRAKAGLGLEENRRQQAEMMAELNKVAMNNPDAWFNTPYSADELFDVSGDNRMVAYPFPKNTMAFMDVDMAASVIVTSHQKAEGLGVPVEKRIYLQGWGYAKSPPYPAQRKDLGDSPAMKAASQQALEMADISIDDVQHLDLYSCFASSLNFTKEALDISEDDKRPLTVTGGLPYFGGPGNNYTTHSIATMVNMLRENPNDIGLISGVGMHLTNHVFALYSAIPNEQLELPDPLDTEDLAELEFDTLELIDEATGTATIKGYTVLHNRDGLSSLAVCELEDGKRCYATCNDQKLLANMETEEWVGKTVTLSTDNKINTFSA